MNINMKKKLIVTSLLAASVLASAANAADGTFNITGTIAATPCTVTNTSAVDMGVVGKDKLDTMAPIELKIDLATCPAAAKNALITFNGTAEGDYLKLESTTAGSATGVALALLESDGTTKININSTAKPVSLANKTKTTAIYQAKFVKKAPSATVGEGTISANLTFDVAYN